jgi:hypothetical protein
MCNKPINALFGQPFISCPKHCIDWFLTHTAKIVYITPHAMNVFHLVSEQGRHHRRSQMKPTFTRNLEPITSQKFNLPHFIVETQSSSSHILKIFLLTQMTHVCVCVYISVVMCVHISWSY